MLCRTLFSGVDDHDLCCINRLLHYARTFHLLEFSAEAKHDIEKLLLKNQVSEKFLHSEVNLLIQHIIVQDQDGQNNMVYG